MKLSELFVPEPRRWGLRGDRYFWDYLKKLADKADVAAPDDLEAWIKKEHLSLSGEELTADSRVYIEQFAHGGMSSGYVSGEWWIETAIPLLKWRLEHKSVGFGDRE